jgi:rhamnosyltransferase
MYKIAAYITAYQDLEAVQTCIQAIQKQSYPLQSIYIIDNSSQPLLNSNPSENIIVNHYPENIGISGGLTVGLQWSIEQGYDFFWTFDQDSEPKPDALSSLIRTYEKLKNSNINLGIIACLPIDQKTGYKLHGLVFNRYKFVEVPQQEQQNDFYECDVVITSGSLMVVSAFKNIPRINDNLFIDAVDWDLCLKLKQHDYRIYIVQKAILNHQYGTSYQITIPLVKKQVTISNYSPLRYYYICRNQTFVETRYASTQNHLTLAILYRSLNMIKKLIKIIIFDNNQMFLKIYATFKGTLDGFQGNLENRWRY